VDKAGGFIRVFSELGRFLGQFRQENAPEEPGLDDLNRQWFLSFGETIRQEEVHNPWFTEKWVRMALSGITGMLEPDTLEKWLEPYGLQDNPSGQKCLTIGLVMAGNIPLVGFHDLMSVLAAGHRALVRPSTKDDRLIRLVAQIIAAIDAETGNRITFTDSRLEGMDAVIATGSNNSSRYFSYYFRKIPHVIRKNRNGVAVLTGKETAAQLEALGLDIFSYFGLGCRNVTKLYLPRDYDPATLLDALTMFEWVSQHNKYSNNVAYYRTIYLMNRQSFLDNGFLLLKDDPAIASPVGVVYYERYSEIEEIPALIQQRREEIQCVVSAHTGIVGAVRPGQSQRPLPWDYADGTDTMQFLNELSPS